jgi:hypothetical protein
MIGWLWRCKTRQSTFLRNYFPKNLLPRSVCTLRVVLGVSETEGDTPCPTSAPDRGLGGVEQNPVRVNTQVSLRHTSKLGEPQWLGC